MKTVQSTLLYSTLIVLSLFLNKKKERKRNIEVNAKISP